MNSRDLETRRAAAAGPLAPLAASLRADMERVLSEAPAISGEKAMLTRDGGRCPRDGAPLDFDPYSPHAHRCPTCNAMHTGDRHHRWWLMFAQLWRAERAVHGAALHALGDEPRLAAFARATLDEYADRYARYPLDDNILGPSRPFFSTYLESIWLLQLTIAADLLDAAGAGGDSAARFREHVAAPSAALIRSYDEGESNRQLWNNAALIAAGRSLGDHELVDSAMHSRSGLFSQLGTGLLADGSWYEGENYHLFSHRGLWYGVVMAEAAGHQIPSALLARFQAGFSTPFLTAFPDLTFPARRDSQFGASLRQWRTAESCELGLARAGSDDESLTAALAALYAADIPHRDTGRWRSAAESERNEPASALTRSDLGWRSLLFARDTLPPLDRATMQSALLEGQGIAVFRREHGEAYVALDYGHHGGGHGHPDRLNVLLAHGSRRILDDMGTGSYVDTSLHWYRSTLAHNAPLVNGRSQPRRSGHLAAWDERGDIGWVQGSVALSEDGGVTGERALTIAEHFAIDELRWRAATIVRMELPLHVRARVDTASPATWIDAPLDGGTGLEDGFSFVHDTRVASIAANSLVPLVDATSGAVLAWATTSVDAEWWSAVAPGAPGAGEQQFVLLRMHARGGSVRTIWDWGGAIINVALDDSRLRIEEAGGAVTSYEWTDRGARITRREGGQESTTLLAGFRAYESDPLEHESPATLQYFPLPYTRNLAEPHYRASEYPWSLAGEPRARVDIDTGDSRLDIRIQIHKSPLYFRDANAPDPALDNENPDINSDGVQLHLWCEGWREPASWLAIPERDFSQTRVRQISGGDEAPPLAAHSREIPGGYELRFTIPRSSLPTRFVALDVLINDMTASRQRRRGQLVLSGAHGDRVYLRGDRQPLAAFLRFELPA